MPRYRGEVLSNFPSTQPRTPPLASRWFKWSGFRITPLLFSKTIGLHLCIRIGKVGRTEFLQNADVVILMCAFGSPLVYKRRNDFHIFIFVIVQQSCLVQIDWHYHEVAIVHLLLCADAIDRNGRNVQQSGALGGSCWSWCLPSKWCLLLLCVNHGIFSGGSRTQVLRSCELGIHWVMIEFDIITSFLHLLHS